MNVGILLPGFSSDETDAAIPVQLDLVRTLALTDHVRVLALRYPYRRDRYPVAGADVIALGGRLHGGVRRLALWIGALWTLRRLHAERPFDVLHAMWADETGLVAAWAGKLLGVPVVVSVLGGELVRLDDIAYGLQRHVFSRWTVRRALLAADAVLLTGDYARPLVTSAGITLPPERIHIAPLGVDSARFSPGNEPRSNTRLLHVGSLIPVKDQATLLRAVARLDTAITLGIAGEGPERARLEALAASLGIACRVRFLGSVPYTDMPALYQQAALLVMTSRSESLPMTVLEAAACGLPTVETDVGALAGTPVVAEAVPVGDDVALAAAIHRLLADENARQRAGQAARAAVAAGFTIEHAAARFRAIYAHLIALETHSA